MAEATKILNFLNGGWSPSVGKDTLKICQSGHGGGIG